jgi:hypothetical protein
MQAQNVIIGTAILWGLKALFVNPLSAFLLKRKLEEPAYAHLQSTEPTEDKRETLKGLATKYYILADLFVLGAAGFVGGLMGYYFIGVSFEAKSWPGMIAFIAASFLGLGFRTSNGPIPRF